jgi:dolichol-phosphate mannosyltransferase
MKELRVLVVLPTYNEAENIENILTAVRDALPECGILVVDDGSPDGTAEIAERVGQKIGRVEILRRNGKQGLGSAYKAGFKWGLERDWDAFVEMDSDFSHDPAALPSLVEPLTREIDLSVGSRYVPGGKIPNWSVGRRFISKGGNLYADVLLGLGVKDSTAGFRAYRAEILRKIDLSSVRAEGYGFQIEMVRQVLDHGGLVTEVPISFTDRVQGESKMSTSIVVEAFMLVTLWAGKRAVEAVRRLRSRASV